MRIVADNLKQSHKQQSGIKEKIRAKIQYIHITQKSW